ncbi:dTDP-glucose 4,6-dehydratase [Amycolatopsis sp. NPDC005961]|uniref:dTDP-glucose 4,6-dehydratase n=1 Tax=Amycolatopsis sp. NPDC005961 TaxID=3156720 RepID=UPI0033D87617
MRIAVTGGAGFIGSNFVRDLVDGRFPALGAEHVTVIDNLTYAGKLDNLADVRDDIEFHRTDICDTDVVTGHLAGHDAVVHFAAESHVDRSIDTGLPFMRSNVFGTQSVLEAAAAAGAGRFVHISTDEVYGSIPAGATAEDAPLAPNSPYAASKAGSDLVALAFSRTHGLPVTVTRCSNNYGPYQNVEKAIPRFITTLLAGGDIPLYGRGTNVRDWLHVGDHCAAVALLLGGAPLESVYNIGGGWQMANLDLAHIILGELGLGPDRLSFVPDRKAHDARYCVDDSRLREEFGYRPEHDFAKAIKETIAWYLDNRSWWSE